MYFKFWDFFFTSETQVAVELRGYVVHINKKMKRNNEHEENTSEKKTLVLRNPKFNSFAYTYYYVRTLLEKRPTS